MRIALRTKIILGAFVSVFLVGSAFFAFLFKDQTRGEFVTCTKEALMCQDGSHVGRVAPRCQFSACPNQQPFIKGMLRQNSEGFTLILPAPEIGGGTEVNYVMPLVIKESSTLGELVGKNVKAFGTFTEGNIFSVDRLELLEGDAGDPTIGEVGVGKSAVINGVRITLNSVVQESRCPIDEQCMEGGGITVNVTLKSNTDTETRNMASDEVTIAFDSYRISIEEINPPRKSGSDPVPESYVLKFKVVSN